ncbi:MAG: InlB B-repeat-containing protein [Bacilli bacterium]
MFIFMPNNVFATTDYGIYVNGEQFTSEKTTINCGDGTAKFDISTNTLILENATITNVYGYQYAVINSEISNLTIQLIGNNVIDGNEGSYDGIGADAGSNVVIVGDGNLTMKNVYYGTYIGDYSVPGGDLKINNTTINIENAYATGIWVNHDLEIINSDIKIDKTGNDNYFGIVSNIGGTITIDGGTLDINTNKDCILLGDGDYSNHNVVIKSGNIKLNSRADDANGIQFAPEQIPGKSTYTGTINGNIRIDGGNLEISTSAGGTNIDDSNIIINNKVKFLEGTSLKDTGKIILNEAKTYTIIYNSNGGSLIESQIVLENSAIQQPTMPTKEGYTFDGWYTDNTFATKFDFNKGITKDTEIFAKWVTEEKLQYEILNGANQICNVDTANELRFRASGDISKFIGLKVDDELIGEENYSVMSGSTIVILKKDYLKNLSNGIHKLTFLYNDGEVSTNFKIENTNKLIDENTIVTNNPKTGDNIGVFSIIAMIALVGIIFTIKLKNKNEKNNY